VGGVDRSIDRLRPLEGWLDLTAQKVCMFVYKDIDRYRSVGERWGGVYRSIDRLRPLEGWLDLTAQKVCMYANRYRRRCVGEGV